MTAMSVGSLSGLGTGVGGSTTHRAGIWRSPTVRRGAVDVAALAVLLGLGALAYGPVFGSSVGYVAAGGGALAGVVIGVVASWRRWSRLGTLLAAMIGYLLLGGPLALPSTTVAGVLPTVETLQRLTLLSWQSWRDLLTVALPAGQFDGPAVLPFLVALAASTLGVSAALRLHRLGWQLVIVPLCPLVLLLVGILWGSHDAPLAGVQGGLFAAVALAWAAWRSQLGAVETHGLYFRSATGTRAPRVRRTVTAVLSLAIAAGASGGLWLAVAPDPDRHVLRDDVVPPLDLQAYPSPLTRYRHLEAEQEEKRLFEVTGLPKGARIRLATMDMYDGNVYNVTEGSAAFEQAGETILPGKYADTEARLTALDIRIDAYDGLWLPGGGDLRSVRFTGDDAEKQRRGLFYNPATGTALTTVGLAKGASYTVEVALPVLRDVAELPSSAEPDLTFRLPRDTGRVDAVERLATTLAGDAEAPLDRLRALEKALQDGWYANGTDKAVPSYAGHTVARETLLLDSPSKQMIGDDEQYAVAMSLMARQLGLPSRVVMGFYPDPERPVSDTVEITGDDAHVWTEVLFTDLGWVTFDPTPDEHRTPEVTTPKPNPRNEPQVLPPPDVPEDREPHEPPRADSEIDEDSTLDAVLAVLKLVALGLGVLALLLGPFLLVAVLKRRRSRARRTAPRMADRISGGWSEIIDLATDLGARVPPEATRFEAAMLMGDRIPTTSGVTMAHRVDGHVFGAADPSETDVQAVWAAVDGLRGEFRQSASRRDRFRARFSPRSLVGRPSAAAVAAALGRLAQRVPRPRARRRAA